MTTNIADNPPADLAGILDDFESVEEQLAGPPCSVKAAIAHLAKADEKIAAAVKERVEDSRYPASKVSAILTQRTGIRVGDQTVRRHRRRGTSTGCRCPK